MPCVSFTERGKLAVKLCLTLYLLVKAQVSSASAFCANLNLNSLGNEASRVGAFS